MLFCFVLVFCSCLSVGGASGLPAEALAAGCWLRIQTGSRSRVCHSVQQQARARCLNPHLKCWVLWSSTSHPALFPRGLGHWVAHILSSVFKPWQQGLSRHQPKSAWLLSSFCTAFVCLPIRTDAPGGAPERKNWLTEDHVWDS